MSRISGCTVHLESGEVVRDVGVLFKDNGWVRVNRGDGHMYYPSWRIKEIERETGQ